VETPCFNSEGISENDDELNDSGFSDYNEISAADQTIIRKDEKAVPRGGKLSLSKIVNSDNLANTRDTMPFMEATDSD